MNSSSGNISASRVTGDTQITDSFGDVTVLLPHSSTLYHVYTHNPFGSTNVAHVPQSPTAANSITVIDNSGNISISEQGGHPSAPAAP
jgi:hypothetical protein